MSVLFSKFTDSLPQLKDWILAIGVLGFKYQVTLDGTWRTIDGELLFARGDTPVTKIGNKIVECRADNEIVRIDITKQEKYGFKPTDIGTFKISVYN